MRGMKLGDGDEVVSLSTLGATGTTPEEREQYIKFAPWKGEKDGEPDLEPERYDRLKEKEQFIGMFFHIGLVRINSVRQY